MQDLIQNTEKDIKQKKSEKMINKYRENQRDRDREIGIFMTFYKIVHKFTTFFKSFTKKVQHFTKRLQNVTKILQNIT